MNDSKDIMIGTKIDDGIVYVYITIVKANSIKDDLRCVVGYVDENTFKWETVDDVSDRELKALKNIRKIHIFVRKVDNEDGIQLAFTILESATWNTKKPQRNPMGHMRLIFQWMLPHQRICVLIVIGE